MGDKEEPKIEQTFKYDERRRILTSTIKKDNSGIDSEYVDNFNEKAIKDLFNRCKNDKKKIQETINQTEKIIETNNDKIKLYKKELEPLTEQQEKLIKDIKSISQYDEVDKAQTQNEQQDERLIDLNKSLKKSKKILNEIQTKVKFKLE